MNTIFLNSVPDNLGSLMSLAFSVGAGFVVARKFNGPHGLRIPIGISIAILLMGMLYVLRTLYFDVPIAPFFN